VCIAAHLPNRFLFLGDLGEKNLEVLSNDLARRRHRWYSIALSAHHGTHWSEELSTLVPTMVVSSCGGYLSAKHRWQYSIWGEMLWRTDHHGGLTLPMN
jgi:beta-lactamase superfamily II metal-dependent hydrolase